MAKPLPNPFRVKATQHISPSMLRITLKGDAISQYPIDAEGGYIKLLFPRMDNEKPLLRTYTIANLDHQNRLLGTKI
ncbi:MAG: siderophore-interacting protein [Neptuniibacter sp.]